MNINKHMLYLQKFTCDSLPWNVLKIYQIALLKSWVKWKKDELNLKMKHATV